MKKQHRSPPFKLLSLLLALAMLFCMIPVSAVALESETAITETAQVPSASPSQGESSAEEILGESAPEEALGLGELSTEVLATMEVNAEDIPEVIPMARAQEKGLVNRLYAQEESLSTVLFQTKSGSKTAYVFDKPVKYVDANGAVRDKSTAITGILNTTYAYGMLDNNVKVYFPRNITNGVLLSYNDYSITMSPEVSGDFTATYAQEENTVAYAGVFGERTILAYTPTLYGVKEDIILVSYTGKNSFDFIMEQQGLTAVQNDGGWQLVNAADQVVAGLGSVIVKDSAGKTAMGELTLTPLAGGKYRVTVTAPEDFLTAEDTVYPVYVDPTVSVEDREEREYYDEEGYYTDGEIDTIIDVGLYDTASGYDDATDYPYEHYLGQKSGGTGRIIYKFYDFYDDNGEFTNMNSGQIGKVTMYLSTYDEPSQSVLVRPMTATWNTTTYGENPVALLNSNVNLWNAVSGVGMSTFDIEGYSVYTIDLTQIVKGWLDYNQGISSEAYHNPANGFCLSADDDYYSYVMSTEGDTVYYEVEYGYLQGDYYLLSMAHGDVYEFYMPYMEEEGDYLLSSETYANITDLDDAKWTFECCGDDLYYIRLASDPSCVLYAYDNSIYATQFVEGSPYQQWEIIQSGATYYIKNKGEQKYLYYGPRSYYYTYQLSATVYGTTGAKWNLVDADIFVPLEDFKLNAVHIPKGTTKQLSVVSLTEGATHTYRSYFTWTLESGSDFTLTSTGSITAPNADNESAYVTVTHRYTGVEKTIGVFTTKDRRVVKRAQQNRYMDISPNSNDLAALEFGTEPTMLWYFVLNEDGTYCIMNAQNQTFMGVESGNHSDGASVVETTYPVKWTVSYYDIDDGGNDLYKLVSTEDSSLSIGMDNSTDCLKLTSSQYGWNKWILESIVYEAYVSVSYDKAYKDRNFNAVERINDIMAEVRKHYYITFGIWFEISEPEFRYSKADNCDSAGYKKGGTYYENDCNCCEDEKQRHKYASNVLGEVCDRTDENIISISFIGHNLWSIEEMEVTNEEGEKETQDVYGTHLAGLARKAGNSCIVMCSDKSTAGIETFTAIHEIGHLYGPDDHYDTQFNTPKDNCVYGYNSNHGTQISISDLYAMRPYCADCLGVIQTKRGDYNP
ncbi:MAG: hypothetical protein E7629_01315 [Ruminococcaceae bacterium]|nr:hypothetical protein [Oscillospiraceae bacterium]